MASENDPPTVRGKQGLMLALLRLLQTALFILLMSMATRSVDATLPNDYKNSVVTMPIALLMVSLALQTVCVLPLWLPPSLARWLPEAARTKNKYTYMPLVIAVCALLMLSVSCMSMMSSDDGSDIL